MSKNRIIAVGIVGLVTALLVVAVIILSIVPSTAHALVKGEGLLKNPTTIITYRESGEKKYTNDASDTDTMKARYNGILERINSQSGMSILSGLFAQNKSEPKVEDMKLSSLYWLSSSVSKTGTADKIIIVLHYHVTQTVKKADEDISFNRAYFAVNDSMSNQTLEVYLFNGDRSSATTMITYNGQFSDLFDYVTSLPTGASTI